MYNLCTDDQCCYLYGSVPRNDSNCVPENGQFTLQYIIYNPHDPFTNLTVRWFRSMDMTRAISLTEVITTSISGEYDLTIFQSSPVDRNCSHGSLYRNTFVLIIHNFTTDKDGYYWCQIVVNDSYLQPSQYAWFYAADRSSCTLEFHFRTASENEIQCAENDTVNSYATAATIRSYESATVIPVYSTRLTNTLPTTSASIVIDHTAYSSSVTNTSALTSSESVPTTVMMILRMTESVIYVAGAFSVVLILLGALVIILILLHVRSRSRRKKDQNNGESMDMLI